MGWKGRGPISFRTTWIDVPSSGGRAERSECDGLPAGRPCRMDLSGEVEQHHDDCGPGDAAKKQAAILKDQFVRRAAQFAHVD